MSQPKEVYLVIGGSGFVGRHIVEHLLARGDIVQRHHDVDFYSDITDEFQLLDVLKKSAGVVFDGGDVVNLDERAPIPEKPCDAYNDSKAQGEKLILGANGKGGLLTVALPAGIFGEGDRQMMAGLYQTYQRGQTHFQVGDNNNLFDYTYVGNLAKAHLIAADKLSPFSVPTSSQETLTTESLKAKLHLDRALQPVSATIKAKRAPTCEARPLGPYVTLPPNAAEMEAAFNAPLDPHAPAHPIIRSRFDQFSDNAIDLAESSPLQVAGQVFFITNGEPMYFWDFMRVIWLALDPPSSKPPSGASERSQRSVWERGWIHAI
ncbi:3-beta hydroxysteroid dehydrogenase/isomerase family-domain-containing protein [Suillus spraguei]|nr:3-beta hydroxysteroid dehydrogenase/isomerase family-domain-containing protein [Suillus spraguei]